MQQRKRSSQIWNDADPKREEENVVEADWVDEQQGVEGRFLVQLAIAGMEMFRIIVWMAGDYLY